VSIVYGVVEVVGVGEG